MSEALPSTTSRRVASRGTVICLPVVTWEATVGLACDRAPSEPPVACAVTGANRLTAVKACSVGACRAASATTDDAGSNVAP